MLAPMTQFTMTAEALPAMPLIGVTGRVDRGGPSLPNVVGDALMEMFFTDFPSKIRAAGGQPILLSIHSDPRRIVEHLDALVLSGGSDVDPRRYGRTPGPNSSMIDPARDEFEFSSLDLAISNPMSDSYAEYRCDFELWEVESGLFLYLGCNVLWSEYFKDGRNEELRKALTYAIDRQTIVDTYYRGRAYPSTLPTSPGSPYYSESLAARYEFDPLRFVSAIQNMYTPKNDKGETKKMLLLVNCDDSARLRTARYIAKELTELGLETGTLEYGGSTGTTYEQVLRAGSFDLYLGQTKLSATYDLSQFFKGYGNLGWGGIADNTLLNMCKEALANSGNYYNLDKLVADDAKIIPVLFGYYEVYAERGQLLDLSPARDNVFFYSIGKTLESSRLATEYG